MQLNCFVDSDHAGDRKTGRSDTGIIPCFNSAPIVLYSKRQVIVEISTFGSEFVVLRVAAKFIIRLLKYKLSMFRISVMGVINVFCDNNSVNTNTLFSESLLKKKHDAIYFHRIRELVTTGIMIVHKGDSENLVIY